MDSHPFEAIEIPSLADKPRSVGITSLLDKGLGVHAVADLVAIGGEWIDVVKLGWGTTRVVPGEVLKQKLQMYRDAGIAPSTGGTFLEIAYAQRQVDVYLDAARALGFEIVEVSNGVHPMTESDKLKLIAKVRHAGFRVWSEVGKKDPDEDARLGDAERVRAIELELQAGSEKVILEARESGNVGIYDRKGEPVRSLLNRVTEHVGIERVVFEAPRKSQQVWLIQHMGHEVNLGNVATADAVAVATLRFGLRGDTFADVHLPQIDVYTGVGLPGALEAKNRGGVVVIVDALRASSTIVAALAGGMAAVKPVATAEECIGEITAGERGGHTLTHCRHGNSPTELLRHDYKGKTLVLTTTNGVECLLASSSPATTVLIGTTLNRTAVGKLAERIARERHRPITLLISGRHNRETIEDALAAGEILRAMKGVRLLGKVLPQSADIERDFMAGSSGRNLVKLGFAEDIRFCAQCDVYDVVPVWRNGLLVQYDVVRPVDAPEPPAVTPTSRSSTQTVPVSELSV